MINSWSRESFICRFSSQSILRCVFTEDLMEFIVQVQILTILIFFENIDMEIYGCSWVNVCVFWDFELKMIFGLSNMLVSKLIFFHFVFANASNVGNLHSGSHFFVTEYTDDFRWWFTANFMDQFIRSIKGHHTLHIASIQSFFIEFLAWFEFKLLRFECAWRDQLVFVVAKFLQFNCWCNWVTNTTKEPADTWNLMGEKYNWNENNWRFCVIWWIFQQKSFSNVAVEEIKSMNWTNLPRAFM